VVLENPNGIDCVRKDETELLLLYCRFDRCDAVERYFQPEINGRVLIVCITHELRVCQQRDSNLGLIFFKETLFQQSVT
jgi:hypothetical protein